MSKIILKVFGVFMVVAAALQFGQPEKANATHSEVDTGNKKLETTTHGCGCGCTSCTGTPEINLKS